MVKEANQPYLHYSNRLVDILRESQVGVHSDRFPQLVSFVGQTGMFSFNLEPSAIAYRFQCTGAGKSTVIKMLIDREQARTGNTHNYAAPVPGLVGDNIPTTGDVHLYEDPGTHYAQKPILYADCEGMTGGESAPRGLACREKMESAKRPGKFMGKKLRKKLAWADNPKMQSREYAVRILFPRILYTFSDVVVFVLREVRYVLLPQRQPMIDLVLIQSLWQDLPDRRLDAVGQLGSHVYRQVYQPAKPAAYRHRPQRDREPNRRETMGYRDSYTRTPR